MTKTIISIWPLPLKATRPRFSPVSTFEIEAAPFDGFKTMTVTDLQQSDYAGAGRVIAELVPAAELAADLAREFQSFSMGSSGAVGVWVVDKANPDAAEVLSSEEYRRAREEQDKLMHNIVINARELHNSQNFRAISKLHYTAAEYLNIQGEAWQGRNTERSQTKECPFCRSFVASNAVICPTCTQVIDPEGYAKMQAQIKAQVNAISQQAAIQPDNGGSALRPALAAKGK